MSHLYADDTKVHGLCRPDDSDSPRNASLLVLTTLQRNRLQLNDDKNGLTVMYVNPSSASSANTTITAWWPKRHPFVFGAEPRRVYRR
jgi:gentisate 1,2-dioxygenase